MITTLSRRTSIFLVLSLLSSTPTVLWAAVTVDVDQDREPSGLMIIAIRSLTGALPAAAHFANAHPLIVAALFLAIAIGLIGLAVLGAISLVKMLIAI
jgi:hypothetical protein